MDNSIASQSRETLRRKFHDSQIAIEAMLKQFKYEESVPLATNMKRLCSCLESVMNTDFLDDFSRFLSNQQHLPIELNPKAIRYDVLLEVFEDWLASKQDHSINLQRMLTHKHRNIIFKRIFLEQKETIRDYFQTLSPKQKLKGFDLFQLLTEVLSPYVLYENYNDSQPFFEKINSFQNFMKIVDSFIRSGRRIYVKDKDQQNDEEYIRLHEFQSLIQFWQGCNPELTIQQQTRKNRKQISVQTNQFNLVSSETQTDKETSKSFLGLVNTTMQQINSLISKQNDPELLSSLDQIFDVLRTQKIFLASYESNLSRSRKNQMKRSYNFNQKQQNLIESPSLLKKSSPRKSSFSQRLLSKSPQKQISSNGEIKVRDELKQIYKNLCLKTNSDYLSLNDLQLFFYNINLTKAYQNQLINNIIKYEYVQDKQQVTLKQFKNIIGKLMKEDKRTISNAIKKYLQTYVEPDEIRETAHFKVQHKKVNINLNQRQNTGGRSLLSREGSSRESAKYTYQMDSDEEYV